MESPAQGKRGQGSGPCQLCISKQLCTSACTGCFPRTPGHTHATSWLQDLCTAPPHTNPPTGRPSPARGGDTDDLLGHGTRGVYMCQGDTGMGSMNNQDTQTPKHDMADRL